MHTYLRYKLFDEGMVDEIESVDSTDYQAGLPRLEARIVMVYLCSMALYSRIHV